MVKYEDLRQHGFPPSECMYILGLIHKEKQEVYMHLNKIYCDQKLTDEQVIEQIGEILDNEAIMEGRI